MFGKLLNQDVFLSLVCQKATQGRAVDARWTAQLLGVTKSTALLNLAKLVDDGHLSKSVIPWRENAQKFYYKPTAKTMVNYRAKLYLSDYLRYMRSMMEM